MSQYNDTNFLCTGCMSQYFHLENHCRVWFFELYEHKLSFSKCWLLTIYPYWSPYTSGNFTLKKTKSWSKTHFLSCSSSMQNSVNVSTATECLPGHSTAPGWEARGWWWASHSLSSSLSHTSAHPPLSGLVGGGEKAELVNSFMTFNYWHFTWKNVKENQDISNYDLFHYKIFQHWERRIKPFPFQQYWISLFVSCLLNFLSSFRGRLFIVITCRSHGMSRHLTTKMLRQISQQISLHKSYSKRPRKDNSHRLSSQQTNNNK